MGCHSFAIPETGGEITTVIGIPKALIYYKYNAFWLAFFKKLGAELKISSNTTKKILSQGLDRSYDEVCLPIKIYYGHVEDLKHDVDYLFIPRIASTQHGKYNCPKFLGLYLVAKYSYDDLPPVIDIDIDENNGGLKRTAMKVGKLLTNKRSEISKAYKAAQHVQEQFETYIHDMGYFPKRAFNFALSGKAPPKPRKGPEYGQMKVALVGHPYNLFDEYANLGLIKKLESMGAWVTTSQNVSINIMNEQIKSTIPYLWEFTSDIVGASFHFAEDPVIDGVIFVTSFGCGPDSMFLEVIQNRMREHNKPFMILTIDEHSAEAGMITRIEAFMDMIRRR